MFGFGSYDEYSGHSLSARDQDKLERAPVHNLDADLSVDFESLRRGSKQ